MNNKSDCIKVLLVGLAAVLLSLLIRNGMMLLGGCSAILLAVIFLFKNSLEKHGIVKKYFFYPSFWAILIAGYFIIAAICFTIVGFALDWDFRPIVVILLIIVSLAISIPCTYLYFLPYMIAHKKQHPQTKAIYVLNIFAGWTILAWVIALIWGHTEPREKMVVEQKIPQSGAEELRKYKELLDQGIISQEEFDAKKKQILGI